MTIEEKIERAAQLLAGRRASPAAKLILVGSHARGDASPGSDLDLLAKAKATLKRSWC